jgi:hypothetical protein
MMQTIDLGATFAEGTLEGVVLGVVYTAKDQYVSQAPVPGTGAVVGQGKELSVEGREEGKREEARDQSPAKTLGCLESAVRKVGERRQMEGVLEFEKGRVSFLVYRID